MQFLCLLLFMIMQPVSQGQPESAVLSASRMNPYVGEAIELKLIIRATPSTKPLELSIPGMTRDESWRIMIDNWLHKSAKPPADVLPLRFHGTTLLAQPIKRGEYQLVWKILVGAPQDEQNPLRRIGPVTVGSNTSNALTLDIQQPALKPPSTTSWYLGVGNYRITASWQPAEVALGEETTLNLVIEGNGALELISPPSLRTMPGWESDRFLLELLPPSWQNRQRLFRYQVRPRQLRATMPPLIVSYFDPKQGSIVTQSVTLPPLRIVGATNTHSANTGSTFQDAWKQLPEFRRVSIEQHTSYPWASWLSWLLWVPLAWAGINLIRMALARLAPDWLIQRRWRQAEQQAQKSLAGSACSPVGVRQILATYLSTGLQRDLPSDWESLHALASQAPKPLHPLLAQLLQVEFGPRDERTETELRHLSQRTFNRQESAR